MSESVTTEVLDLAVPGLVVGLRLGRETIKEGSL